MSDKIFQGGIGRTTDVPFVRLLSSDGIRAYTGANWQQVNIIRRLICWLFGKVSVVNFQNEKYYVARQSFQRVTHSADLSDEAISRFLSNIGKKPQTNTVVEEPAKLQELVIQPETVVVPQEPLVESTFIPYRDMNSDTDGEITSHLDDASVLRAIRVCTAWKANSSLQSRLRAIQVRARCRRENFPNELICL